MVFKSKPQSVCAASSAPQSNPKPCTLGVDPNLGSVFLGHQSTVKSGYSRINDIEKIMGGNTESFIKSIGHRLDLRASA